MGFDVIGPTRHVRASNVDDGEEPLYDVLTMPKEYGLACPQLEKLNDRFYESTRVAFAHGEVAALRDELVRLTRAYRASRELELISERRIRAKDANVRAQIVEELIQHDPRYRILEDFRMLCEEAISEQADVRCVGD